MNFFAQFIPRYLLTRRSLTIMVTSAAAIFVGLIFGGVALMNVQKQVELQAEQIIAQESYEDELLEMLDIYHIELALADAEMGDEE